MSDPKPQKPLGRKSYGRIPHLPNSRLGPGEHTIPKGQVRIFTEKTKQKADVDGLYLPEMSGHDAIWNWRPSSKECPLPIEETCEILEILDSSLSDWDKIREAMQKGSLSKAEAFAWLELIVRRDVINNAVGTVIDNWAQAWLNGSNRSIQEAQGAHTQASVAYALGGTANTAAARRDANPLAATVRAVNYAAAVDAADEFDTAAVVYAIWTVACFATNTEELALQVMDLRTVLAEGDG